MSTVTPKVFDINSHLQESGVTDVINYNVEKAKSVKQAHEFSEVLEIVKKSIEKIYEDRGISSDEKIKRQEIEHNAILGDHEAEKILTKEIEKCLREQNLLDVKYPDFFDSLAQALFHEIYGFGAFYKWKKYPESVSASIIGKEIWFKINGKFVKQEEELRDEQHIYEIFRALEVGHKGLKINHENPRAEIEMKDGTRLNIVRPPADLFPVIVFRRFIISNFSFEEQARRKTISSEDVELMEIISELYLNMIIAGHVESGKSTMLKTIYASRSPEKIAICIETSPESFLKKDFPDRLVYDFYTVNGNIEDVIYSALRTDHDYVIFQEVRGIEADGAMKGAERGTTGMMMTYHITDPSRTPEQLAQHIVDAYANRKLENEIRRVAKNLDLGIIMKNDEEKNAKRLMSIYEICYDYKGDKAWINYLMKYNELDERWEYNSEVSEALIKKMKSIDRKKAERFIQLLQEKSNRCPITTAVKEDIIF
ncbi:CpaF/VirB11 family protein [Bacillus cereus]|nr:CpaF/VirB11 family protein [Bacillus cereus]